MGINCRYLGEKLGLVSRRGDPKVFFKREVKRLNFGKAIIKGNGADLGLSPVKFTKGVLEALPGKVLIKANAKVLREEFGKVGLGVAIPLG